MGELICITNCICSHCHASCLFQFMFTLIKISMINRAKSLRTRRNILINFKTIIQYFPVCNYIKSALELKKCSKYHRGSKKLALMCRIRDVSCRFKLACSMDPILGMHCQKGQHIYTNGLCCDFVCISKRSVHFIWPKPPIQVRVIG